MTGAAPPLSIDRVDASTVRVGGVIGFGNARAAVERTGDVINGAGDETVDLAALQNVDSATLGVLLIWAADAARRGGRLHLANAPAGLRALAHLCDAETLLGLQVDSPTRPTAS